jgi:hypothetical protein
MGAVLPRVRAAAATAWSVVYLVAYLWVVDAQNGAIAWWYVVLMVFAALSFAVAGTWARAALTVGVVISALARLVGLLSLGALLAPTVVAVAIALVVTRPAHTHVRRHNRVSNEGLPASRWSRDTRRRPLLAEVAADFCCRVDEGQEGD